MLYICMYFWFSHGERKTSVHLVTYSSSVMCTCSSHGHSSHGHSSHGHNSSSSSSSRHHHRQSSSGRDGGGTSSSSSSSRSRQSTTSSRPPGDEVYVGKYKLVKTIGKGNFAKVKLAKHMPTGQEVCGYT